MFTGFRSWLLRPFYAVCTRRTAPTVSRWEARVSCGAALTLTLWHTARQAIYRETGRSRFGAPLCVSRNPMSDGSPAGLVGAGAPRAFQADERCPSA